MRAARHSRHTKIVESAEAKTEAPCEATARVPKQWEEGTERPAWIKPRTFAQVPTHVVGVPDERRAYPRAALSLPLRLKRVAGQREPVPISLVTRNISSSGVYFLCPRPIDPGTPIELEVGLVERPLGRGSVRMSTAAHVVRIEPTQTPGWHGLAATFDDITFQRDEPIPPRFRES
jgi:hypothetical protein